MTNMNFISQKPETYKFQLGIYVSLLRQESCSILKIRLCQLQNRKFRELIYVAQKSVVIPGDLQTLPGDPQSY